MTSERSDTPGPARPRVEAAFPLTPLQEGMLYHALRAPTAGLYHIQSVVQLEGPLVAAHFQEAWRLAAHRHEAFRTFFAWERREQPVQVVLSDVTLEFADVDWTALSEAERSRRREALVLEDRQAGLDVSRAPMMRFVLARLAPETHELLWSVNHAVFDGWSARLVLDEVLEDYDALLVGRPPQTRPTPPSYAKFVRWMAGRGLDEGRAYWGQALEGVREATPLPAPDLTGRSTERVTTELELSQDETDALRAACGRHRVTANTVTVGAWGIVLGRHAGRADVVTGMTLSERPLELPGVERAAGLYLSTIPVRIRLQGSEGTGAWLRTLQGDLVEACAHSGPSLPDIQRWSGVRGEALIQSLVVFERFPDDPAGRRDVRALTARSMRISGPSDLPLALLAYPGDRLRLQLAHDPAQISGARASALLDDVRAVLIALSGRGEQGIDSVISAVTSPSPGEVTPKSGTLLGVGPALPSNPVDVITLFETHVAHTPDAIAIRASGGALSYRELDQAADAVARCIRSAGLPPGSLVGLLGTRAADTIAGMLGVLKGGCAYAPLDPALPPARLLAMAAGLDAVLVLDGCDDLVEQWPVPRLRWGRGNPAVPPVDLATDASVSGSESASVAERPAYVIHTSGSTGAPKGVMVSRGQLAWSTAARFAHYGSPPRVFLLLSSLAVDSSVAGVYAALCGGGALVLPDTGAEQDVAQLSRLIASEGVTDTLLVPSLYRELLDTGDVSLLASLQRVIVAGEACPDGLKQMHQARLPRVALHNEYGPSEATVWATVDDLTARPHAPVTIGQPVALCRVYLVDSHLRLVPPGEAGEMLLGGPGVAMGYLNQPELTAERFFDDPWSPGGRLYRTGDRARWRSDGRLEFLGRADDQIKIRGYRVEPVEIEMALQGHAKVAEALVGRATREDGTGQLVALVRSVGNAPSMEELDAFLADRLPPYMIPSRFLLVERLPRTAAGKLDRSGALERHGVVLGRSRMAEAPRTATERTLVEIWKAVLGVEEVGIHDDFFAIGGDSLLSIRAISRAARAGVPVSPASFFAGPSIAQIARAVTGSAAAQDPVRGEAHLTPIQGWFFEQFGTAPHRWNQAFLLRPAQPLREAVIERAVAELVLHHDALRLRFEQYRDSWRSTFDAPSATAPVRTVDLTNVPGDRRASRIEAVANEVHAGFALEAGSLFQAVFFDDRGGDQRLLLVAHHLVVDALSWGILFDDLATLLEHDGADAPPALPSKTRSFQDWTAALRTAAASREVEAMASLWTGGSPAAWGAVTRGFTASTENSRVATARKHVLRISPEVTRDVLEVANRSAGASVQELALAGLLLAWERWTGQARLQLDLESHGRDVLGLGFDVSRTVGWFTSAFPIRLDMRRDTRGAGAEAALEAVRKAVPGSGLRKASYGLLRYLHPDPAVRQQIESLPGSDLLFNYLGSLNGMIAVDAPFVRATEPSGSNRNAHTPRAYVIEINAWIENQSLTFDIEYSTALHRSESMARFAEAIAEGIRVVAQRPSEPQFALAGLDAKGVGRLADLLADLDAG